MVPELLERTPTAPTLTRQTLPVAQKPRGLDTPLFVGILILLTIGTIEVYSSSAVYASKEFHDSAYFLKRHLVWLGLGFFAMWMGVKANIMWLKEKSHYLLLFTLLLLVSVLIFGARINGAKRWFVMGPISFQPVELAKLALICYLAASLSRKHDLLRTFRIGFVPHLIVCGMIVGLLLLQPDLGSSIILAATTLTLLFVAGTKISYISLAVLLALPMGYHLMVGTPWRLKRFMAYFNPESFADTVAYQIVQARIAVGSGGVTGMGLGEGRQQLGYMPEGHSDFILSSIGEELGLFGILLILCAFSLVLWRSVKAALWAKERFQCYLALGIGVCFCYQALVNTGVVLGVLPAKGLTLPLVSYGGTSLVMSMFLAGLLLNIASGQAYVTTGARSNMPAARKRKYRAIILT